MLNNLKKIAILVLTNYIFNVCLSQQINIAVAANFLTTTQKICYFFEKKYKKCITSISSDSTSNLFTKIKNKAPFNIFMSADKKHANILAKSNFYKNKTHTYAKGYLTLSKKQKKIKKQNLKYIKNEKFFTISNPKLSPYGKSSKNFNSNVKLNHKKIILGPNINHTFNLITNNTCNIGINSFSQSIQNKIKKTTYWKIPQYLHKEIKQKIIILKENKTKQTKLFLKKIKNNKIRQIIKINGYK
jgi:molybdate transport system substrate-binding protein